MKAVCFWHSLSGLTAVHVYIWQGHDQKHSIIRCHHRDIARHIQQSGPQNCHSLKHFKKTKSINQLIYVWYHNLLQRKVNKCWKSHLLILYFQCFLVDLLFYTVFYFYIYLVRNKCVDKNYVQRHLHNISFNTAFKDVRWFNAWFLSSYYWWDSGLMRLIWQINYKKEFPCYVITI